MKRFLIGILAILIIGSGANSLASDYVYPSDDIYRFHEWIMPLRIKYTDVIRSYEYVREGTPYTMDEMKFNPSMIRNLDDYIALRIYLNETIYKNEFGRIKLFEKIEYSNKTREYVSKIRALVEERARMGTCDDLTIFFNVDIDLGIDSRYIPDFPALINCMSLENWRGTEKGRQQFVRSMANQILFVLASRLRDGTKKIYDKAYLVRKKAKEIDDPDELQKIFNELWNDGGKEVIETAKRDNEYWREQAPELLRKYGPYPKPGWIEQINKIRSKSMEEWDAYYREKMGEDGLSWQEKVVKYKKQAKDKRRAERERKNISPDKVKEPAPEKSPEDESDSTWAYWLALLGLIPFGAIFVWIRRKRKQ